MNIIIVDPLLFGEVFSGKGEYIEKISREFLLLGANLLIIRAEYRGENEDLAFRFRERNGVSEVLIGVKKTGEKMPFRSVLEFNSSLMKNSAGLAGIFKPDCVIFTEENFLSFYGAQSLAKAGNAVLITKSFCAPKRLFPFGMKLFLSKRAMARAQKESAAVLGFYPHAQKSLKAAKRFYQMRLPYEKPRSFSEKAVSQRETVASFGEGNTFVLAFASPCEKGYCAEEVITAFGELSDKFALVFIRAGAQRAAYRKFVAEKGITNVFFLEETAVNDLPFVLKGANGVFVSENSLKKGEICEHREFFSAVAAARPVIAAVSENADFFRESMGAIITKPHQKESIALGIKTLAQMSTEDREMLGACCENFALSTNYKKHCEELLALIQELKENLK